MAVNYQLQDKFLDKFFSSRFGPNFYLTGGTALARYYFQHRESLDLDLFTQNQQLDFSELNLEIPKISTDLDLEILNQVTTDTYLQYVFKDSNGSTLKVDFVKDVPVRFGELKVVGNFQIDSLENIGSNKILAIFGRTDHKDFIDLYYILNETKFTLDHLVSLAKQKDLGFTEFYFANAIKNIETTHVMPVLLKPLDMDKYHSFYQELATTLFNNIKPE